MKTKTTNKNEEKTNAFNRVYVGKRVRVTDKTHPLYDKCGKITGAKMTAIRGLGVQIEFDDGESAFISDGMQIQFLA
jgi:hypothetical protein